MSGQMQQLSDNPKKQKMQLREEYHRQLKKNPSFFKKGQRLDGFNRTNDGMTNHERVLHQRRFREKAAR